MVVNFALPGKPELGLVLDQVAQSGKLSIPEGEHNERAGVRERAGVERHILYMVVGCWAAGSRDYPPAERFGHGFCRRSFAAFLGPPFLPLCCELQGRPSERVAAHESAAASA